MRRTCSEMLSGKRRGGRKCERDEEMAEEKLMML
jgi:hypothetical protein